MPFGLAKRITTIDSSAVGMSRAMNGLLVSTVGHALEVDVRAAELRADVVHVVGHAAQDRVDHRLLACSRACVLVAVQLLDPLEIDDRHHADQQVHVPRDVDARSSTYARRAGPRRTAGRCPAAIGCQAVKVPGSLLEFLGLGGVVHVAAHAAAAASRRSCANVASSSASRFASGPKWLIVRLARRCRPPAPARASRSRS